MGLSDCICMITGKPGIFDQEANTCCCRSPLIGFFCDGTMKDLSLWRDYRGYGPPPELPPGKQTFAEVVAEILA